MVPCYGATDLLEVALAEIWHYGRSSTQIPERLAVMLEDLHEVARPEYRHAMATWLHTVRVTPGSTSTDG